MKKLTIILMGFIFFNFSLDLLANSAAECGLEGKSCNKYGAAVFQNRCSLCHGSDGLGEGVLALSIKKYPNTNLLQTAHGTSYDQVMDIVRYAGGLVKNDKSKKISVEMPPWGDELTVAQLESVVNFVLFLRKDTEKAMQLLREVANDLEPSLRNGRAIFLGRCSLCHGKQGLGDGKMSRIIKDPPPFNLTLSRAPDQYLSDLIHKGGETMGRSSRMPPFGDDLSESDIKSVIIFLKTLRN